MENTQLSFEEELLEMYRSSYRSGLWKNAPGKPASTTVTEPEFPPKPDIPRSKTTLDRLALEELSAAMFEPNITGPGLSPMPSTLDFERTMASLELPPKTQPMKPDFPTPETTTVDQEMDLGVLELPPKTQPKMPDILKTKLDQLPQEKCAAMNKALSGSKKRKMKSKVDDDEVKTGFGQRRGPIIASNPITTRSSVIASTATGKSVVGLPRGDGKTPAIAITTTKNRKPWVSRSEAAGLIFPVGRVHRHMKYHFHGRRIAREAPVFLAGALQYVVQELVVTAKEALNANGRSRITPRFLQLGVKADMDFSKLWNDVTIREGGVVPNVNRFLVNLPQHQRKNVKKIDNAERNQHNKETEGVSSGNCTTSLNATTAIGATTKRGISTTAVETIPDAKLVSPLERPTSTPISVDIATAAESKETIMDDDDSDREDSYHGSSSGGSSSGSSSGSEPESGSGYGSESEPDYASESDSEDDDGVNVEDSTAPAAMDGHGQPNGSEKLDNNSGV